MDTIAAIATMGTRGGVGIIRLSGPDALRIGESLFSPKPPRWESRKLYYGSLRSSLDGRFLDSGLFVWMQGPRSFTGEDVVEFTVMVAISTSGGFWKHLAAGEDLLKRGIYPRAFLNDKMDLSRQKP